MPDEKFPWARLMRVGLADLNLPPHEFWRSTLRELLAATGTMTPPMLRQNLHDLMQRFPD